MAFTTDEIQTIEWIMKGFMSKRRPPVEIRNKVDLAYKIEGQSIEIYEIRPKYNGDGKINLPIAKTTFSRSTNKWKIYWQKSDLKWHQYDQPKEVDDIKDFIKIVDDDSLGCFWG